MAIQTATFGRTTVGGIAIDFPYAADGSFPEIDCKLVSKFTLPRDGSVTKLSAAWSNYNASRKVKGIIYDSAGVLKGTTNQVVGTIGDNTWQDLPFASPVSLSAGDYYLGVISEASTTEALAYGGPGTCWYGEDTYSDGAVASWNPTTGGSYTAEAPIFATYTYDDSSGGGGTTPTTTTTLTDTFGRKTPGTTSVVFPYSPTGAAAKAVSLFTLPRAGSVSKLTASWLYANATAKVKGVIYARSADGTGPGALLGTTNEVTGVIGNSTPQDLVFQTAVGLAQGDYYLGVIASVGNLVSGTAGPDGSQPKSFFSDDAYADGPSNPFGTATADSLGRELPIYATYSYSSTTGGTPTPDTQPPGSVSVTESRFAGGAKGDGSTDDTAAFRAAAATGSVVWVPQPSAHYKITGPISLTNSIYGENRPLIRFYGAGADGLTNNQAESSPGCMFAVVHHTASTMLVISKLRLDGGWRTTSTGPGANGVPGYEYSHCISIRDSRNVKITGCELENPVGDCVSINAYYSSTGPGHIDSNALYFPDNIVVEYTKLVNAFRCLWHADCGTNLYLRNCYLERFPPATAPNDTDEDGIPNSYVRAIDLEPDPHGNQYCRNVYVENNVFNTGRNWHYDAAFVLYNFSMNPVSGPIYVRNNTGVWSNDVAGAWPGSNNFLRVILPDKWANGEGVVCTNNVRGSTAWSFPDQTTTGGGGTGGDTGGGSAPGVLAAYDASVQGLKDLMATLNTPTKWNDLSGNTTVDGAALRAAFAAVYLRKQALQNAMAAKTKATADAALSATGGEDVQETFYQATAPTTSHLGAIWHSTDTTTNCPDANCTGHARDASGNVLVGSYPHAKAPWKHIWDGSAWKDAGQKIVAGSILTDDLAANVLKTTNYAEDGSGNPTAGAKLDHKGTAIKVAPGNLQIATRVMSDLWFLKTRVHWAHIYSSGAGSYGASFNGTSATATRVAITGGYGIRLAHNMGAPLWGFPCAGADSDHTTAIPFFAGANTLNSIDIGFKSLDGTTILDPASYSLLSHVILIDPDVGQTWARL